MTTIHPTNTCFDDALDFIVNRLKENPLDRERLIVVHGICLIPEGREEGTPFAHAWVEEIDSRAADVVWQGGILDGERIWFAADRAEIYAKLRVQETTRYTVREAAEENARTCHYGPWEEKYRALLRKGCIGTQSTG